MRVEIVGPYYDDVSGQTIDTDLLQIVLTKHRICSNAPNGRVLVGHCRKKNETVLIFPHIKLAATEIEEIKDWVLEDLRDQEHNWPDNRANLSGGRPPD